MNTFSPSMRKLPASKFQKLLQSIVPSTWVAPRGASTGVSCRKPERTTWSGDWLA